MKYKPLKALLAGISLCLLFAAGCTWQVKTLAVETPPVARSTLIFDANGNVITHFRGEQHRLIVQNLDEIPTLLQNAVIAIEDERFWQHSGVDAQAIIRAARSNINQGGISEGGSTITQQYVGLTFLDRTDRSTSRKVEEIALALQFERLYSKEYILREYLNVVYFGEGAYGIKAAAQEYFGDELDELTIAEAALLAGLIQAPATFNPYNNPTTAIQRREEVLSGMLENGWITQKEYDTSRTEPLVLRPRVAVLEETYVAPHFVEEVRQWVLSNPLFGETRNERAELLFEGGLYIYTTLDPAIQATAEEAVAEILPDIEGLEAAVVVLDNDTGYVKGLVGGRDFFSDDPQARFNLATQGARQAGSAMKPITLASALEQGFELRDRYHAPPKLDIPIGGNLPNWEIEGGSSDKEVTLYDGLVGSINTVYAQLSRDVGPTNSVNMAERLGIKTNLEPVLSITLGSESVTTLDMATVYSTFARRGIKVDPTFITRVVAADGTLLYEHNLKNNRVLDRDISDQVTRTMVDVVDFGTGWRAQIPNQVVAGKTGTAENFRDATFSGYTPKYTVSVWVGFAEAQLAMEPPLTPIRVSGGTYPAQIFQLTMGKIPQDQNREFALPTDTDFEPIEVEYRRIGFRMPNVIGASREAAVGGLDDLDLVVGIIELIADDESDPRIGTVVGQDPRSFAFVSEGDLVTLTVVDFPTDCRNFLSLIAESELPDELVLVSGDYIEDNLEANLEILSQVYTIPENCTDLIAEKQNIENRASQQTDG